MITVYMFMCCSDLWTYDWSPRYPCVVWWVSSSVYLLCFCISGRCSVTPSSCGLLHPDTATAGSTDQWRLGDGPMKLWAVWRISDWIMWSMFNVSSLCLNRFCILYSSSGRALLLLTLMMLMCIVRYDRLHHWETTNTKIDVSTVDVADSSFIARNQSIYRMNI